MIRHVPLGSTHLGRIAALNQLSREICSHECSLRDAWVRLEECKSIPKIKTGWRYFSVELAVPVSAICSEELP